MTDVTGVAIRTPRPPWLPLWGSCHEVTERVNSPSPPLRGTSPIGRGKTLVRLALAGDARALHSGMTATGSHYYFRFAARSTTPFTQGSRGCSYTGAFAFFNNIFMRANSLWRAVPKRTDHAPKGEAVSLKKTTGFLRGLPPTLVCLRGHRRQKHRPGFAGKGTPFLQYPGRPAGDSGGFWIFSRYPNWTFRDSGHFCPRKIPLRPLLLFETGRIQTATVAQLGQE